MSIAGLYAILDLPHRHGLPPAQVVAAMLDGGAGVIQLRSKREPPAPELVGALAARCAAAGVPLILNDELELAERISGVAGVHLGQGDLGRLGADVQARRRRRQALREAGLCLGVSTHDLGQLRAAIDALDPDYVGFGPVFATSSKPDHDPTVGLELLTRACEVSPVPVVAIGGIGLSHAAPIASRGAAAIAVIGALIGETVEIVRERSCALSRAFAID